MNQGIAAATVIATLVLPGCAADVQEIRITSVRLTATSPSTDEIPYGSAATVNVFVKMDKVVTATAGQIVKIQLWDDDGPGDDQITKEKKLTIKQNRRQGNVKINISCTNKGELKGNKGTDTDDGSAGAVREYELFAYDTVDQESSAENDIKCVPMTEDESGGSSQ